MCSVLNQVDEGKAYEVSHELISQRDSPFKFKLSFPSVAVYFNFKWRLGFDEFQEIFVCSVPKQVVVGKEYEESHEMNSQRL